MVMLRHLEMVGGRMDCSGHLWLSDSSHPSSSFPKKVCGFHQRPLHPVRRCGVTDGLPSRWPSSEPHWCVHWAHKLFRLAVLPGGIEHPVFTAGAGRTRPGEPRCRRRAEAPRVPGGLRSPGPRWSCRSCAPGPCGCPECGGMPASTPEDGELNHARHVQ